MIVETFTEIGWKHEMRHLDRGLLSSTPALLAAAVVLVLGGAVGCTGTDSDSGPTMADREAALADTIRSLAGEMDAAWTSLEPDAYLQHYSDSVRFYYQGSGLGRAEFEKVVREEMSAIEEWSTEVTHDRVEVLGLDGAVASFRYAGQWTDTAGETRDIAAAVTLVFERRPEGWTVVQAHESLPPDVELP